ncbi:tRNA pseudouridine(55) synthase TruB [Orbus sturtevantii]|uniref:tRNA pseudouridine(55) synthase TruB n=1 Tax=Orbus sturtevantii TaxID=3074109 RepID=UPI00370D59B7
MARKRKGRDVQGVLLLDKPAGMTSNDVLQKVKRVFNAQKAGHTGALDPLATGMLPICFGESTKFSQYLLDSDKRYRVIARLGQRTDTSDSDGQIIAEKLVKVIQPDIEQGLIHFRGDIMQIPTMFSALKYQGRPLYEYARQGITIERQPRPITVYENRFIAFNNNELELEIHCSKGTYIRTIIDDLGELLGCGAHIIYLRRLQVSNYPSDKMVSLSFIQEHASNIELLDSLLLSVDSPVQDHAKIALTDEQGRDILLGRTIEISQSTVQTQLVRLYQQTLFIGIGQWLNNSISPKRLIQTEQ